MSYTPKPAPPLPSASGSSWPRNGGAFPPPPPPPAARTTRPLPLRPATSPAPPYCNQAAPPLPHHHQETAPTQSITPSSNPSPNWPLAMICLASRLPSPLHSRVPSWTSKPECSLGCNPEGSPGGRRVHV